MTLKEYLEDYASPDTKAKGEAMIQQTIPLIPNEKVRRLTLEHLKAMEQEGVRDFRF